MQVNAENRPRDKEDWKARERREQAVQRQGCHDRCCCLDPKDLKDAGENVAVHRRQQRRRARVSKRTPETVAGNNRTGNSAEGPVLEDEGIHPFVVEKRNDSEANRESDHDHESVRLEAGCRGGVGIWH